MRKILFILLLAPFALKSQTVNTFRDSTWFKRGVRFDSTLVFSKGAGVGKVWTSNANGTGSWQTFSSAGVTQGALDDSISAVRAIRKVDTIYKNLDSIVFKINGLRYSIKDSTGTVDATVSSYGKNTGKDSTILVLSDGTRYSAKDSIANLTGYALQVSLNDTANVLRGLIPNVSSYATITNLADTSSLLRGLINTKGTGTVTSVATDATLTGGTITTSGTLKVDTSVISTKANVTGLLLGKSNISDTANQNLGIRTDYINRLTTKQDNLISGTSIKTINSTSLLGSGNILTPDAQTLSAGTNTLTISGGNTVNLNRKVDTSYIGLNATRDSLIFNNTINGTAYRYAVRDSTGGGGTQYGGNNTLYVSKQGSDATGTKGDRSKPYLTIQAAIDAAVGGDVVLVMEGTYVENIALKDSVKLISETWGAATIQHNTITNSWGISSPDITVLGSGIYNEIFITGFRITNPQMEPTIKIKAKKLTVKLAYLEVKSKNVSYQSKIQLCPSSTSAGVFECDVVDINSISNTTQFGFDGAASDVIGAVYAVPTCHIKVCNFTEITTQPQDYIGWQNWDWRIDAVNSNTINAGGGFGEMYHQNCNGHVGIYRSIRTGAQGNNSTVFSMPAGNQTLTIDYFYSEGQERIISCGAGNDIINIGWMQTDGLIFISPSAGKTTILNAQTIKRVNSKATAIFYIFPTGANGKVKLNCNYAESNGSGSGVIYTYNSSNVNLDIYLSGEFYNSNSTNSLVIQDDANATVKYKVIGSLILRNNQSAATKFYGSFAYNRNFYIVGGMGVTNSATGAGTVTTVTGSIQTDTGL